MSMSTNQLRRIQDRESDWIMAQPGVHGTGIQKTDDGELALAIYCLPTTSNETKTRIQTRLQDVPIMWVGGDEPVAERL